MSNLLPERENKEPGLEKIGWKQNGIQWQPSTLWAPAESCVSEQNSPPLIFLSPSHCLSAASRLPVFEDPELSLTRSHSSFGTYTVLKNVPQILLSFPEPQNVTWFGSGIFADVVKLV